MREIEFGLWANEQTLFASFFMIIGSVIAVAGKLYSLDEIAKTIIRPFSTLAVRSGRRHSFTLRHIY